MKFSPAVNAPDTIVIDRGQWNTGAAQNLLDEHMLVEPRTKLKCVQAFYAEQMLGANPAAMENYGTLESVFGEVPLWMTQKVHQRGIGQGMTVDEALGEVNDSQLHQARREARVALLFKHYGGFNVEFTGRYADATRKARAVIR